VEYNNDKVDDAVLALLWLRSFKERDWSEPRASKDHDWDALNRLHEKGYISNPKSAAKSVVMTEEGFAKSRELSEKFFGE
jgi:hypothetical protein